MISAKDLKDKKFTVVSNGYDIEEVEFIIQQAADTIDAFTAESSELYHKLEVLAAKIEEYREEEDSIKAALITAQKMADKMKKESNETASLLISKSEETAKQTLDDANEQADKIITSAREFSSTLISEKTAEAEAMIADAQAKSNEAISSAKIVAQDILDQAKEISDDLISKSKQEKEAYEILVETIKKDANSFVENVKAMYAEQLNALESINFDAKSEAVDTDEQKVDSIQEDVDSLVGEIEEIATAIPDEIEIPETIVDEPVEEIADPVEEVVEEIEEATDEVKFEFAPVDNDIEEIEIPDEEEEEDDEPTDPMAAVAAFSQNEFTPIDINEPYIPVISEEPDMEEKSLFDSEDDQLPFESYFNVKTEDAHSDRSQTISLVPPEDDDEPKFKGFFKKKK